MNSRQRLALAVGLSCFEIEELRDQLAATQHELQLSKEKVDELTLELDNLYGKAADAAL